MSSPRDAVRQVETKGEVPHRAHDAVMAAELLMMQGEIARELTPETEYTGDVLRRVRESQGVELADIALRSKISTTHLRAIEAESPADLPAMVYVQGFVTEFAKYLKLDPTQVSRTYAQALPCKCPCA